MCISGTKRCNKNCYKTSQGVGGTCCLHLQGAKALKTGIRIHQHKVLLAGNRTVKLISPRAVLWTINKTINTLVGYISISTHRLTTGQENAWWQNCYERALDEQKEDFRKVGYLHSQAPWEPQISLHNTRLPVRNKYTHTHTQIYIRSLLARTIRESSGDVKSLFQSSTLEERNLKVAPQYEPTALSPSTWINKITQDRK